MSETEFYSSYTHLGCNSEESRRWVKLARRKASRRNRKAIRRFNRKSKK